MHARASRYTTGAQHRATQVAILYWQRPVDLNAPSLAQSHAALEKLTSATRALAEAQDQSELTRLYAYSERMHRNKES